MTKSQTIIVAYAITFDDVIMASWSKAVTDLKAVWVTVRRAQHAILQLWWLQLRSCMTNNSGRSPLSRTGVINLSPSLVFVNSLICIIRLSQSLSGFEKKETVYLSHYRLVFFANSSELCVRHTLKVFLHRGFVYYLLQRPILLYWIRDFRVLSINLHN